MVRKGWRARDAMRDIQSPEGRKREGDRWATGEAVKIHNNSKVAN